jgi:hypothetical protein
MPDCPQSVKVLPALPPYPSSDNALIWLVKDDPLLVEFAAVTYVQLKAALKCIQEFEDGYARLDD